MGIPAAVSQAPPAHDLANAVVQGSFTIAGQSASFMPWGPFNVFIYGPTPPNGVWAGTIRLERSFDGGTNWFVCGIGGDGTQAIWTTGTDVSFVAGEPERGMLYRLNCTVFTTGPIGYRMSASGGAAMSLAVSTVI